MCFSFKGLQKLILKDCQGQDQAALVFRPSTAVSSMASGCHWPVCTQQPLRGPCVSPDALWGSYYQRGVGRNKREYTRVLISGPHTRSSQSLSWLLAIHSLHLLVITTIFPSMSTLLISSNSFPDNRSLII